MISIFQRIVVLVSPQASMADFLRRNSDNFAGTPCRIRGFWEIFFQNGIRVLFSFKWNPYLARDECRADKRVVRVRRSCTQEAIPRELWMNIDDDGDFSTPRLWFAFVHPISVVHPSISVVLCTTRPPTSCVHQRHNHSLLALVVVPPPSPGARTRPTLIPIRRQRKSSSIS